MGLKFQIRDKCSFFFTLKKVSTKACFWYPKEPSHFSFEFPKQRLCLSDPVGSLHQIHYYFFILITFCLLSAALFFCWHIRDFFFKFGKGPGGFQIGKSSAVNP